MDLTYDQVQLWLEEIGADLRGVVPSAEWAAGLPAGLPHRSVLIFGAGGPEFIRRYQAHAAVHGEMEHWLADYAHHLFADRFGGDSPRYLHPYRSGLSFPFQRAAVAAGMGVVGLNHVVLTPEWGPWFSFLGAVLLEEAVPETPRTAFDPCTGCPAPCLKACPSGAVSREGYDGLRCLETKLVHTPCLHACPARHACMVREDLRREMIQLEASRRRDDEETRQLMRSFLGQPR